MCGLLRNILISPQRTLPNKTINNCFERDKKKFLCELNELRNFRGEHNLKRRKKRRISQYVFFLFYMINYFTTILTSFFGTTIVFTIVLPSVSSLILALDSASSFNSSCDKASSASILSLTFPLI